MSSSTASALRRGNPTLSGQAFTREANAGWAIGASPMTIQGAVDKTALLLLIAIVVGAATWLVTGANDELLTTWTAVGAAAGLVVAIATTFKPRWAPVTAPLYAALEGMALGGVSKIFEAVYAGIVLQAIALTAATLGGLLLAYRARLIRATRTFWLGVTSATFAIVVVYLVSMVLGLFDVQVPFLYDAGPIGIGFSLLVVGIAALNLVLDFAFIENGVRTGAPKYMEWYAAFGLMVTLVWLYLEILRLLAKLREE